MDRLTLRVDPNLIRRFDAAAASHGGRSRYLRRLMDEAAQTSVSEPSEPSPGPTGGKLTLRFTATDLSALEAEAAAKGLLRTQWAVALIRSRLHRRPQLSREEGQSFVAVQRELRRIGININQIGRALSTAGLEGAVLDRQTAKLAAFSEDIRAHVTGLREAFEGNLAYWSANP